MNHRIIEYFREMIIAGDSFGVFLKKVSTFLIAAVITAILFPTGKSLEYSDYVIGSVVTKEIIAPFTFPILKTQEELDNERQGAISKVPLVFEFQPEVAGPEIIRFRSSLEYVADRLNQIKKNSPASLNIFKTYTPDRPVSSVFIPELDSLNNVIRERFQISISRTQIANLIYLTLQGKVDFVKTRFERILKSSYAMVILDREKDSLGNNQLILRRGGINTERTANGVLDLDEAQSQAMVAFREEIDANPPYINLGTLFVHTFIMPNWHYAEGFTEHLRREAIASVPTSKGFVYKNERIVDSHQIVTNDIYRKLKSLASAIQEESLDNLLMDKLKSGLGRFLLAILILSILASYLFYFRQEKIWSSLSKLILINLIIVIEILFAWILLEVLNWPEYTVPMIFAPMLLVILLDGTVAFIGAITVAFIIGGINGLDYSYTLTHLFAGIASIYTIRQVRKRTQIFSASLIAWLIYFLGILAFGLVRYQNMDLIFERITIATLNVVFTPIIVYGVLGIFEKMFDITTDFTLLELSDMNHPLLKQLSQNASGTFSHSIEVGNLAEAGAKAINANSLLTRVGCYYHDIGKMEKSEYYVENQMGGSNKHDNLTPTMSALVISSHVKLGLELADKYNLPADIENFIPEHHGTSPMEYFLHKAKEVNPDSEIDENNFRYPGPKPQSKETAIVMLADSIEAASRTLKEPSASRIQTLVDTLVEKKINDHQLDESSLTFREISQIENAFAVYLMSKFHLRIEYPDETEAAKDSAPAPKKKRKIEKT